MFEKQDLTAAIVRLEAMLGESRRAYEDAKETLEYYKEEYDKARSRYNAALDTVERLQTMLADAERIRTNEATWRMTL